MGVRVTLDELVAALETVGVPVLPPGTPTGTFPAIVLGPGDWELAAGGRRILVRYQVTIAVPRDETVERVKQLDSLTRLTLQALGPADCNIDGPISFQVGTPDEPPYLARQIPIAYTDTDPESDLCLS